MEHLLRCVSSVKYFQVDWFINNATAPFSHNSLFATDAVSGRDPPRYVCIQVSS